MTGGEALRAALDALSPEGAETAALARAISARYRQQSGGGRRLVTTQAEALAYALSRMPATFGAASFALARALEGCTLRPRTLLDAGAGTGSASWAAASLLELEKITCLEREEAMCALGRRLAEVEEGALGRAQWLPGDLTRAQSLPKAELVVAAYVLGEMERAAREEALLRLWEAAEGMLLLLEPGTPEGARQLHEARTRLLALGGHIAAPCAHSGPCPVPWCHFSCRVARSRVHRQLKGGEAPYEDEKFCYLAVTRAPSAPVQARVLRHPRVEKGRVRLELCTPEGEKSVEVTRREGARFHAARKLAWGLAFTEKEE